MKILNRLIELLIIIVMALLQKLPAQSTSEKLEKTVQQSEEIRLMQVSRDGRWMMWQGVYETEPSEMKIIDAKHPEKMMTFDAKNILFIHDHNLLIQKGSAVEFKDPVKGTTKEFQNVKAFGSIESNDLFWIYYDEKKANAVEVYNKDLKMIYKMSEVDRVKPLDQNLAFYTSTNELKEISIFSSVQKKSEKIYSGKSEVYSLVESKMAAGGWLMTVMEKQGLKAIYVDKNHHSKELVVNGQKYFDVINNKPSANEDGLFLIVGNYEKMNNDGLDIWYGNEFNLSGHFRKVYEPNRVIWFPEENKIQQIDSRFIDGIAAGKSGRYLSIEKNPNQVDYRDTEISPVPEKTFLYDPKTGSDIYVDEILKYTMVDPLGKILLYKKDGQWISYEIATGKKTALSIGIDASPYFAGETVLWTLNNELWSQDMKSSKLQKLKTFEGKLEVLNARKDPIFNDINISGFVVDLHQELLLKVIAEDDIKHSVISWKNGVVKTVINQTNDKISSLSGNNTSKSHYWIAENYNKNPSIMKKGYAKKTVEQLYESKQPDTTVKIGMKRLQYKGPNNEDLTALLYLPPNIKKIEKLPVVVFIYELQRKYHNDYLLPTFKNQDGFSIRLLLEAGFMVMLPDITKGSEGPGISALYCVNQALDQLSRIEEADMAKVGLMGRSFGGYETNFIATQSNRFAAYISGTGLSDPTHSAFAFNYGTYGPDYARIESGQYGLGDFAANKEKYIKNSPIFYMEQVKAPMLLWSGLKDKNVSPEGNKSTFSALRKYRKQVIALLYTNENHGIIDSGLQKDLTTRIIEWWEYFLKGKRNVPWILKQTKDAV